MNTTIKSIVDEIIYTLIVYSEVISKNVCYGFHGISSTATHEVKQRILTAHSFIQSL